MSMSSGERAIIWIAALAVAFEWTSLAVAQTNTPAGRTPQGAGAAKPAAGPVIYLDEPEVISEPTIVRHEKIPPETYPDGKVRVERQVAYFSDDHVEADGPYREYYPNGKLFVEGEFRRGRQQGAWTFYFDNGQVNRKASYVDGQPHGQWDVFRADGTLSAKRSFKNGIRDGAWITYDDSGKQQLREEHFVDGKADGVWKVWFANGKQKQQGSFKLDVRHGATTEWNENGEVVIQADYVDGKLEGKAMQRLPDGRTMIREFKAGRPVSRVKSQ